MMDGYNYTRFVTYAKMFAYQTKYNPKLVLSEGRSPDGFLENIGRGIQDCKIFEIDEEVKKLLVLTKAPNLNENVKLPFPFVFLDCEFTREELAELGIKIRADQILGILFTTGVLMYDGKLPPQEIIDEFAKENHPFGSKILDTVEGIEPVGTADPAVGTALRITMLSVQKTKMGEGGEEFWFDTFAKNFNIDKKYDGFNLHVREIETTDKKARDFVHKFVINFLNFLYNPEVQYVEHIHSQKNIERRKKEGKIPIPNLNKIRISGELKKYIDTVKAEGHLGRYSYRFWVRGFFRTLRSPRYKENIGKRIFVPPFVKGKGVLVKKMYEVQRDKE